MTDSGTDSSLDLQAPPPAKPKLRGLWGLMRDTAAGTSESKPVEAEVAAEKAPDEAAPRSEPDRSPSVETASARMESTATAPPPPHPRKASLPAPPPSPPSASEPPKRSLWALMGVPAGTFTPASPRAEAAPPLPESLPVDRAAEPPGDGAPPHAESSAPAGGKGLWALMRSRGEPLLHEAERPKPKDGPPPERRHIPSEEASVASRRPEAADAGSVGHVEAPPSDPLAAAPRWDVIPPVPLPEVALPWPVPSAPPVETGPSRTAHLAAAAGGLSIALSALAWLPPIWMRFPATIAGFLGLAAGLSAWTELARPRSGKTGKRQAVLGIACGLFGMFVGPLAFTHLGAMYRESSSRGLSLKHLATIGQSLGTYYEQRQRFPEGGTFRKDDAGRETALHGWMAALLPFVGETPLYEAIRFEKPYDDPVNQPALSRTVKAFLAAGGDPSPVRGLGPAHFAGVGGQVVVPGQGLVHLGVFDKNSSVRHEDIVDGDSQTLIVGEIAPPYLAWGEPDNWRTVGSGLNKQPHGFGNAEGSGAHFLKADGSVQFFSNKTSPDVLQRMSTRDGGESLEGSGR